MNKNFYILLLVLIFPALAYGQMTQEKFGRNRVQFEQFDWRYLSSENFDVYFYRGGDKIAKDVVEYLENEFDRVTDLIGYPPYSKTKLFLYNSVADLQQSNVGIDQAGISPGGETQFIKPYIEAAHQGSIDALKRELLEKISSLMVNEMMFGGSLKDMFQSSVLLNLPEWFISGAALYVANGWSVEMDDYIRDYINTKRPEQLNKLTGKEAALAGQSVWNYIVEQYGRSNLSNILNYTRIIRNEEKSIAITLGVPFEQVLYNWQTYYLSIDQRVDQKYQKIPEENKFISGKNRKGKTYKNIKLNTTGTKIAYTENDMGRYKVIIEDLASGKSRVVLSEGNKVINQEVNFNLPLIDWVDSTTLGIVHSKYGRLRFVLYDYNSNSSLPRRLDRFEQVQSMNFSDNGRLLIISAVVNGQNDLFLLSTRRDRTKRLSDDIYDDIDASFVPNSNTVVFASNRKSDTLNLKDRDFEQVGENFNLFFYNLDTTDNVLTRVTNTISRDTRPMALDSDNIFYLSDQKGIINLFKYNREDKIYSQVTNYESSIEDFDINFDNDQVTLSSKDEAVSYIYYMPDFNLDQQIFTPTTPRKQVLQAREFKARRKPQTNKTLTIQDIVESRLKEKEEQRAAEELDTASVAPADTVVYTDNLSLLSDSLDVKSDTTEIEDTTSEEEDSDVIDTDNYNFESVEVAEEEPEVVLTEEEDADLINTDDYKFETDVLDEASSSRGGDSFLAQYRKLQQRNTISGPYPYEPRFSAKNLVTSFLIDPLRGFGIQLQTEMYDILENHRFNGGILVTTDLRSGDIFAEYHYLKSRFDYSARFERNVILRENSQLLKKYSKNTFQVGAALPFNNKLRLEVNPFFTFTQYEDLTPIGNVNGPTFNDVITQKYIGATSELVYDNSIINGMNLIEGSRAKVKFSHYEGIDDKDRSFSKLSVDLRHYQKIHREIVFAARVYYGSFFGRDPKQYLLGGMDNWIFKDENEEGDNNPLNPNIERKNDDLLFMEYATNLRGFDYATIVGESTLLFNAELRIPLIRYLASGPITSNFFRNLQFTGFFDIGSAWTGESPFSEDNTISTETIKEGAFVINIKNFQNPWLYSYGAGMRSMILGYYVKFDLAWPVEDYNVGDPRFMLTLGYDF